MPKLSPFSQSRPPSSGLSRRIHGLRRCSAARKIPYCSIADPRKRKVVSFQARKPSQRAKRPRSLLHCSLRIHPIWGAKRARSALSSTKILPIREAKRARSAFSDPLRPVLPNEWRDWTDLGEGLVGLIAECLLANDVADYVSFRAVCRPWRLCSTDPRKHGILDRRFHPHQWIILREGTQRRRFMNMSTGNCRYMDLPDLHGQDLFPTTEGLLIVLDRSTFVVRVLNPFTRQAAELPPATTLLTQRELPRLSNPRINLLEVTGAGLANESTIGVHFGRIKTVAIVKPGVDAHWIVVDRGSCIRPAMSFAGRFYCATGRDVMVVETSTDHPPRLAMAAKLIRPLSRMMMDTVHLVDHEGELILVDRRHISNDSREFVNGNGSRKYSLFRVDLDARKIVPVHSLGGRAVFIGMRLALSVSPVVFPSLSADAIYLGFDQPLTGRLDNSPIHLMDGTSETREFNNCSYGPPSVDDYLSWFVTEGHGV